MKRTKEQTKLATKPRAAKLPLSTHGIAAHAGKIREIVHGAMAKAGINDLHLNSMQFGEGDSCADPCPPNQHRQMVCRTMPDGSQVCTCDCVDD